MKNDMIRNGNSASTTAKTAEYISSHLVDLAQLARNENLPVLVYLIEMAQIEALEIATQIRHTR